MTREQFDALREPRGALVVGSPQEVIEKILLQHEIFGHQRFLAQLSVGDTLQLSPSGEGAFHAITREGWADDPHARGRAFLRRYNKNLSAYES